MIVEYLFDWCFDLRFPLTHWFDTQAIRGLMVTNNDENKLNLLNGKILLEIFKIGNVAIASWDTWVWWVIGHEIFRSDVDELTSFQSSLEMSNLTIAC